MRIFGVDLPSRKKLYIALTRVYGIGIASAKKICVDTGIDPEKKVNDVTDEEILALTNTIKSNYVIEGELRGIVMMNIRRLISMGAYRGLRHRRSLPCRGQRTHTNAKTRRKFRKIAGN